ncbi:hypothetical protein INT47_009914 [Mucor saturninus]|uniref:Uncharacterized protein n=1 Tax=Mucor saturninus TaxID=64648 RepID=A0A8H7QM06_9FUNG|nr:hypothetical protein INT47_009914 [Mucor saturninus]
MKVAHNSLLHFKEVLSHWPAGLDQNCYELFQFIIPTKYKPGTDEISKEVLKDERVIDFIVTTVVGCHGLSIYTTKASEWIDGKKADMVYAPIVKAAITLPPALVEVQNTVDKPFIRHNTLSKTVTANYMKLLPSTHWAQAVYFLDEKTIKQSLLETPLVPLVAIEYVFSKQQQSLFGLEKKDDPIVMMIYSICKKALAGQISIDERTVNALLDVFSNTNNQFKRIIDAVELDGQDLKRIKQYALDSARYMRSCSARHPKHTA